MAEYKKLWPRNLDSYGTAEHETAKRIMGTLERSGEYTLFELREIRNMLIPCEKNSVKTRSWR